jgi:hypothetical protein
VVAPTADVAQLEGAILHRSYRDFAHIVTKTVGYYQLQRQEGVTPSRLSALRLVFELPYQFVKYYIFRRHIFGGADGFVYACALAMGRWARIFILSSTLPIFARLFQTAAQKIDASAMTRTACPTGNAVRPKGPNGAHRSFHSDQ